MIMPTVFTTSASPIFDRQFDVLYRSPALLCSTGRQDRAEKSTEHGALAVALQRSVSGVSSRPIFRQPKRLN
jgi:hypothetical protein